MTRAGSIWLSAFLPYSRIKGDNGTPDSQLTSPSGQPLHFHRLVAPVGRGLVGYDPCGFFVSVGYDPMGCHPPFIVVSMVYGHYIYAVVCLLPGLSPTVLLALRSLVSQPWLWLSLPARRLQLAMTGTGFVSTPTSLTSSFPGSRPTFWSQS